MTETDTLIKRISTENGRLLYLQGQSRYKLADCNVDIEIWQHKTKVQTLGALSHQYRKNHISLVICDRLTGQRHELTEDFVSSINAYEISADLEHQDGTLEHFYFGPLYEADIDITEGRWQFKVEDYETVKKLVRFI